MGYRGLITGESKSFQREYRIVGLGFSWRDKESSYYAYIVNRGRVQEIGDSPWEDDG